MHLSVRAIGKDSRSPKAALTDDYLTKARAIGRGLGFDGPHISVFDAPKSLQGPARQAKEADLLLHGLPDKARAIVLDERGKSLSSRQFAETLAKWRDDGAGDVCCFIGGADGFGSSFSTLLAGRPVLKISFGAATWPHLLVRAMLAEQLYRSMTLLSGHPYHRD